MNYYLLKRNWHENDCKWLSNFPTTANVNNYRQLKTVQNILILVFWIVCKHFPHRFLLCFVHNAQGHALSKKIIFSTLARLVRCFFFLYFFWVGEENYLLTWKTRSTMTGRSKIFTIYSLALSFGIVCFKTRKFIRDKRHHLTTVFPEVVNLEI